MPDQAVPNGIIPEHPSDPLLMTEPAAGDPSGTEIHGSVPIFIDGHRIHAPRGTLTGAEIRRLPDPAITSDRDLWLDVDGGLDNLIEDDEPVALRPQMRFFTVPKVINPGGR